MSVNVENKGIIGIQIRKLMRMLIEDFTIVQIVLRERRYHFEYSGSFRFHHKPSETRRDGHVVMDRPMNVRYDGEEVIRSEIFFLQRKYVQGFAGKFNSHRFRFDFKQIILRRMRTVADVESESALGAIWKFQ